MSPIRGVAPAVVVILVAAAAWLAAATPAMAQLTDADVYVAEATLAIEDKQWDRALDLLRQALAKEPDHVEALYYTGVAYMGKRQPAEAVKYLEPAREKSPTDTSIAYQLGLAYVALEQYDKAQPLLEQAFARDPTLDSLGYYVGYLRYRKEQYQDALRAFRAARTADPTIADLTRLYAGLSLPYVPRAEFEARWIPVTSTGMTAVPFDDRSQHHLQRLVRFQRFLPRTAVSL